MRSTLHATYNGAIIRHLPVSSVQEAVRALLIESAYRLPADYLAAMQTARKRETSELGGDILTMLLCSLGDLFIQLPAL